MNEPTSTQLLCNLNQPISSDSKEFPSEKVKGFGKSNYFGKMFFDANFEIASLFIISIHSNLEVILTGMLILNSSIFVML